MRFVYRGVCRRSAFASRAVPSAYHTVWRSFSSSVVRKAYAAVPRAASATSTTIKPTTPATKPASSTSAASATSTIVAKPTLSTSTSTAARPAISTAPATPSATSSVAQRTITPQFVAKEPPVPTNRSSYNDNLASKARSQRSLTDGLSDTPPEAEGIVAIDWARSFHGLGSVSFAPEQSEILLAPIMHDDVEVKPDGIIYLPEIKYRRILNRAFGPGGWGLAPRGESIVTEKLITREYGLIVEGRLVSTARGEQQFFDPDGIPTATEGCKSNALMRCCKDLGIASELWDPRFIRDFSSKMTKEVWVEHVSTKKKRKIVVRKDDVVKYPFKEVKS